MASGQRLGDSLIWEYSPRVRIERAYLIESDVNGRALPEHLWRCYVLVPAEDWNEEHGVGKHPLNGHETSSPEFWIEIGRGTEDEMDKLAIIHAQKLKGKSNGS